MWMEVLGDHDNQKYFSTDSTVGHKDIWCFVTTVTFVWSDEKLLMKLLKGSDINFGGVSSCTSINLPPGMINTTTCYAK
jgi:hypothetical protein